MNGFDFNNFNSFPFVLSLSKDFEKEFQRNPNSPVTR